MSGDSGGRCVGRAERCRLLDDLQDAIAKPSELSFAAWTELADRAHGCISAMCDTGDAE